MSDTASGQIFLSYRRDDTQHVAGRLRDRLAERFGDANVFMDVDSIEPGLDFSEAIERAVSRCDVLLALIGTRWLRGTDEHGQRRLDDPEDLVRLEIKSALDRDVRVIPVLVDGAKTPRRNDLPEILAPLARRNAVRLDHETFGTDLGRLIDVLDRAVQATNPTAAADSTSTGLNATAERVRDRDEDTHTRFRRVLGDDHPSTLASATNLAADLSALGRHQWACELDEDTHTRYRRVLGDDHLSTLASATNLATDLRALGEHQRARELDVDTHTRFRRVLGDDHLSTLASATNLATDLHALGEHQRARELDEDTHTRYRRVLGDDHLSTLASATNLATDLHALGEHQRARELDEDTHTRYRRVLGDDHPSTLASANNLAANLSEELRAVYDLVTQRLLTGKVVPVLGAGINLCERPANVSWERGRYLPTSQELATELAQYMGMTAIKSQDLTRVSRRLARLEGEGPLYDELHDIFAADYPPTLLHRFLARLSHRIREAGEARECMLIVTTNYDDSLERAFAEEGEPYELLTYIAEGRDRGLFRHITADGELTVIRVPHEYVDLRLEQRTVITKVLGSADRIHRADSFVITEEHYIDYFNRVDLGHLFPFTVAAKLRTSPLLYMGYSLHDWKQRMMLDRLRMEDSDFRSWAIQHAPDPIDRDEWDERGVDVLPVSMENFVAAVEQRLSDQYVEHRRPVQRLPLQYVEQRLLT